MSVELSDRAKLLLSKTEKQIYIVAEIEGLSTRFSSLPVSKLWRIGDEEAIIGDDLIIGGGVVDSNVKSVVNFDGSTRTISQQINVTEGSGTSIQSYTLSIVDENDAISPILNGVSPDILSKSCVISMGFIGGYHPIDSIVIFQGVITSFSTRPKEILLTVQHPDTLKKQEIFTPVETTLSGAIDASTTTIPVNDATIYFVGADAIESLIKVDDEIMLINSVGASSLTVTRAYNGTTATTHDINTTVNAAFNLTGKPIETALKLMLSGAGYVEEVSIIKLLTNKIAFRDSDIAETYGLIEGDYVYINDSTSNDGAYTITGFSSDDEFSYIEVVGITAEITEGMTANFKSQYDVLPIGFSMKTREVDVARHLEINNLFGRSFPSYSFTLLDSEDGKDFLEKEIYRPVGIYSMARKGRSSCGFTAPPLGGVNLLEINSSNVVDATNIKVTRSINQDFYNATNYKFGYDAIEDDYFIFEQFLSADSINRIKVNNRPLVIESRGLTTNARPFVQTQSKRYLDRYRFAVESFETKLLFSVGARIEVGDTVLFDGKSLNMFDSKNNSKDYQKRILEVQNKSLSISTGEVTVNLVDTNYQNDAKYGTHSPSSRVTFISGNNITIESLLSNPKLTELEKWSLYYGSKIRFHSIDWTTVVEADLVGTFDGLNSSVTIANATGAISVGMIMGIPKYLDATDTMKTLHAFNDQDYLHY